MGRSARLRSSSRAKRGIGSGMRVRSDASSVTLMREPIPRSARDESSTSPSAPPSTPCRQINVVNVDKTDWRCGIEAHTLWPFHRRHLFQEIME